MFSGIKELGIKGLFLGTIIISSFQKINVKLAE
jgi:hypothetical protein